MRSLLLIAASILAGSAARAEVIVIDPAGGSGAPALNAALAAAMPYDVILLKAGNYDQGFPFAIDTGITLLPAPGAGRIALRLVEVSGLGAGLTVVLRGFDINSIKAHPTVAPLEITNVTGTVWVEDCTLYGGDGFPSASGFGGHSGTPAAYVSNSSAVFRNCTFLGGRGADAVPSESKYATFGGAGLVASGSTVALHDCTLLGGDSGNGTPMPFFVAGGGHALIVDVADATVAGCTLTGGAEGADNDLDPGISGSAIRLGQASSDARVLQCTLAAGPVQGAGTLSPVIDDPPHKVVLLAEAARELVLPDQVREGESGTLLLDGEPGDLAMVLIAAHAWLIPLKGQDGTLLTALITMQGPLVIGVLPGPDGQLVVPFTLPHLPPGTENVTVFVQGLFKDADGTSLGGASALTWVDAAL